MDTNPALNRYMDRYFDYPGHWDSPWKCGLKLATRKDGKILAIATEIYRQNPGTPVTEVVASLATRVMKASGAAYVNFIFIEHTPDLGSKLTFYGETFDQVDFDHQDGILSNPVWTRLSREQVDQMMEE